MSFTSASLRRNRDLWIAVVARAVSLLGDEAALVALTLRLHDGGSGAWWIAVLFVAGMAPLVLLAPIAGALVDRYDSRVLLVWSGLAQTAACLVLVQLHSVPLVLALVAVLGAGQAVNGATWQALLPSIVGADQLPAAIGMSQAVRTAAGIAAPAVGGALTGLYGARVPLLVDAATFLIVVLAGLMVRTRRRVAQAATPRGRRRGYGVVRDDPVIAALLTTLAVFIVLGAMVNVIDVYLVRDTLHSTATWYGLLGGTWGAGMLLGSLVGGRWSSQLALARVVRTVALSLSMLGYTVAPGVAWLLPVAVAGGAANGLLNLGTSALTMMRAPEHARGRISAATNGIASAAMIGAFVLGGALAAIASPRQIFLIAGLFGMLAPLTLGRWLLGACRSAGASTNRVLTST
ncbi:MAG TPA: MFS transporter [Jatrophihabitantaceae bacterium]